MANRIEFVQKRIAKLNIRLQNTKDWNKAEIERIKKQIVEAEELLHHHLRRKHRAACNRQRKEIINKILED